jgi:hypothetical protein
MTNPEKVPEFIENLFEYMNTKEIVFSLHEFPIENAENTKDNQFRRFMVISINEAAKKALTEYYQSHEEVSPEEIIKAFQHLEKYDWGETCVVQKALTDVFK